jgi:hypothetical protein
MSIIVADRLFIIASCYKQGLEDLAFTLIMVDNARFAEYGKSKSRGISIQKSGGMIATTIMLQIAKSGGYGGS